MEFKIIIFQVYSETKVDIFETKKYNNIISTSKKGGLKLTFTNNTKWFSLKQINNYEIHKLGKNDIMIFSDNYCYDKQKIIKCFINLYLNSIKEKINNLQDSLKLWNSIKKNYEN
jgi:hypothetical protein